MKRIAGPVLALLVSACANSTYTADSDVAYHARIQILGLSRAQILACAGKPERTEVNGDQESFSYSASSGETSLMVGAGGQMLSTVQHSCEVTYVLLRGYVSEIRYGGGRTGGTLTPDAECAPLVRKCLGVR